MRTQPFIPAMPIPIIFKTKSFSFELNLSLVPVPLRLVAACINKYVLYWQTYMIKLMHKARQHLSTRHLCRVLIYN